MTDAEQSSSQIPPGVMDALLRPSRTRLTSRTLDSFPTGLAELTTSESASSNSMHNKYDLLCPRAECASLILRTGVASLVEKPSLQLEPPDRTHSLLPPLPDPPASTHWWLITPSPMEFENIGFSKPLPGANTDRPQMKLLVCAECELGPLGWSEVGGTEFWLACNRVGYRAST